MVLNSIWLTGPLFCEPLIPKCYKHDADLLNRLLHCFEGISLIHIWPTDNFKLISKLGRRAASTALKKKIERDRKSRMESLSYWNICPSISVRAENPSAPLRKKKEDGQHWKSKHQLQQHTAFIVGPTVPFPKRLVRFNCFCVFVWLLKSNVISIIFIVSPRQQWGWRVMEQSASLIESWDKSPAVSPVQYLIEAFSPQNEKNQS